MQLTNVVIDPNRTIRKAVAQQFEKASGTVKAHARKSKSGKLSNVSEHMRHVSALHKLADYHEKMASRYSKSKDEDDREEASMYRGDARDYRKLAKHLKNKKWKKFINKHDSMDTAARDEVSSRVHNFAYKRAHPNED